MNDIDYPAEAKRIFHYINTQSVMTTSDERTQTFDLDNYRGMIQVLDDNGLTKLEQAMHEQSPRFNFKFDPWMGGAGVNLVATDIERQQAYDKLPKPYTMRDVIEAIEKAGIYTDLKYHVDLDRRITADEYHAKTDLYIKVMSKVLDDEFDDHN